MTNTRSSSARVNASRVRLRAQRKCYSPFKAYVAVKIGQHFGLKATDILANTGLTSSALTQPGCFISKHQLAAIFTNLVAAELGSELAIALGSAMSLIQHGALGIAILTSPNVAASFDVYLSYPEIAAPTVVARAEMDERYFRCILSDDLHVSHIEAFNLLTQAIIVHSAIDMAGKSMVKTTEVTFSFAEPADAEPIRAFFGCPVHFSRPLTSLTVNAEVMAMPLPEANPEICATMLKECERQKMEAKANLTTTLHAERLLRGNIKKYADLNNLADALSKTPRSLRRHLS